jgi:glycosyltransferase involved in cell wall biosynthesis
LKSGVDILVVGIDSTGGWTAAAADLTASLTRAGARVQLVSTGPVPSVRTFALTDLSQARMARRVAQRGIAEHAPAAIVYCSVTASLLWPRPGAISLDCIAAENRPGRHGIWQRRVERLRLAQAPLLLLWSQRALAPLRGEHAPTFVVPPTVDLPAAASPDPPAAARREIDVVAYAGDPEKRRLEYVLDAWRRTRREGETLVVAGHEGLRPTAGVQCAGRLSRPEFRRLLRRARVFVSAPRREEFGIAALEALAEGCMLVTTPAPGPYPGLDLARALDPRLVARDIAPALRIALDDPPAGYAQRATALLAPFGSEAVDRTIAQDVLPRLLAGCGAQLP